MLLAVCGCMELSTPAFASLAYCSGSDSKPELKLTVLIANYAKVRRSELCEMELTTRRLLWLAGIAVQLVSCSSPEERLSAACQKTMGATRLSVCILPTASRDQSVALGSAVPDGTKGWGANIYWANVESLAGAQTQDRGRMLGAVAAHEIGHLLLGTTLHSTTGIMQKNWYKEATKKILDGGVISFTSSERNLSFREDC